MKNVTILYIILVVIFNNGPVFAQKPGTDRSVPVNFCISKEEMKLADMVNEYRSRYGLAAIPLSRSLFYVAATHVKDLYFNKPDKKPCNVHSWSDKGNWKPFCYPGDEDKKNSVWDKPKELTNYKGKGYEIVYWENGMVNTDSIMTLWKSEDYFNSFLVNSGKWTGTAWSAIGIGIYENYAVAWFGMEKDAEVPVYVCGSDPPVKPAVTGVTPAPRDSITTINATTGVYYIIVKSQLPLKASEKEVNALVSKGYYQSKIIQKGNTFRVSIMEFPAKANADSALREVKKLYKDAWIMEK